MSNSTAVSTIRPILRRFGWDLQDFSVRRVSPEYVIVTSLGGQSNQPERIASCLRSAGLVVGEPFGACISVMA